MALSQSMQERLTALLAQARANKNAAPATQVQEIVTEISNSHSHAGAANISQITDKYGATIELNTEQSSFVQIAATGKSGILIGAAGTGKTTCMKATTQALIQSGYAGIYQNDGHKHLTNNTPGIICCSYTRRAVANLKRNMPEDMKGNCITIHKLLEYAPVYYEIPDPETGKVKNTMRFEATRNAYHPLSSTIKTVIIDEASMVSVELFGELVAALPPDTQFIFLGDIQQLPPVFGSAILGYKMLELPTIELVQVYRQALESPIIRLAHRILSGKEIKAAEYPEWKYPNQLTIHPWKKKLHADVALMTIAKFLTTAIDNGAYNPEDDMVLIPFNKSCGTIELNNHIANHLARKTGAITYEVIAGFNKLYLSVGDKVLYDKEDAIITDIQPNPSYEGARPQLPSATLDYWGFNSGSSEEKHNTEFDDDTPDDIDFILEQSVALGGEAEDRVRQASHLITLKMLDSDGEVTVDTAAKLNTLILSYALTVHKSQGSEWRKVFLMLHQSHATMLQRELLYTAVTRAREELYVICEPESFTNGINSQRIVGNTLAEKAEYFKGKVEKEGGK